MIEELKLPATFYKGEQVAFIECYQDKCYMMTFMNGNEKYGFGTIEIYVLKKVNDEVLSVFIEFDGDMVGFNTVLEFDDNDCISPIIPDENQGDEIKVDPYENCFYG